MKVTLAWGGGETKTLYDVEEVSKGWNQDEWVVEVRFRDGERDVYTGKEIIVSEVIEGVNQPAECAECENDAIGVFDGEPLCQMHASTRDVGVSIE